SESIEHYHRARKAAGEPKDHTYSSLEFGCDWAVHPVIDWENGKRIVRRFNQFQELVEAMNNTLPAQRLIMDMGFLGEFGETIRLAKFRQQLGAFLRCHNIDPVMADGDENWANFLSYYGRVIQDCPLRAVDEDLKFTDEVT